ncbi:hypothetical protein GJ496_004773 [Pomphorhynchus laevis]|nr:hypothetical protein GJ496_004773 [Pomphorhynchus laevis]
MARSEYYTHTIFEISPELPFRVDIKDGLQKRCVHDESNLIQPRFCEKQNRTLRGIRPSQTLYGFWVFFNLILVIFEIIVTIRLPKYRLTWLLFIIELIIMAGAFVLMAITLIYFSTIVRNINIGSIFDRRRYGPMFVLAIFAFIFNAIAYAILALGTLAPDDNAVQPVNVQNYPYPVVPAAYTPYAF